MSSSASDSCTYVDILGADDCGRASVFVTVGARCDPLPVLSRLRSLPAHAGGAWLKAQPIEQLLRHCDMVTRPIRAPFTS